MLYVCVCMLYVYNYVCMLYMYICRILHMTCDCTKNVDMQSYHPNQPLGLFLRGLFFRYNFFFHCLYSTCCFTCIHEISHVVNTLKSKRYEEGNIYKSEIKKKCIE